MKLTLKQEEGLKIALDRYKHKEPYTCIAGFAGTGKSTLVRFIIDALEIDREYVTYAAYTGKAANVLKRKGNPNPKTTHRLLYDSFPRVDGTFYRKIKRPLDRPYKLIVIDEVSMLPEDMWELLLSHNIHVLALGDPGQLPPVKSVSNDVLDHPHVFLDEVLRQAQESDILRLSMEIRDGKPLSIFHGQDARIISWDEYRSNMGALGWADQVICAKNATRIGLNKQMRYDLYGWEDPLPQPGDKIICLKNNWDCINPVGDNLVNGLTGRIDEITYKTRECFCYTPSMFATFIPDYVNEDNFEDIDMNSFREVRMDRQLFLQGEPFINNKNFSKVPRQFKPNEFDYGYAVTCHKAQGSEFDKVLVFEEYMKGDTSEKHRRWLYTAVTRAAEKLVLVKA